MGPKYCAEVIGHPILWQGDWIRREMNHEMKRNEVIFRESNVDSQPLENQSLKLSTGNAMQQKTNTHKMTKTDLMCLPCFFLKRKFLRILTSRNILFNQLSKKVGMSLGTCKVCHRFVAAIGVTCRNQALEPVRSVTLEPPVLWRLIRRQAA